MHTDKVMKRNHFDHGFSDRDFLTDEVREFFRECGYAKV